MQDSEREDLNILPSGGMSSDDVQKVEGEQVKRSLAKMDQNELGSNVGAAPEDWDVRSISLSLSLVHVSRLAFFSSFSLLSFQVGIFLDEDKALIIRFELTC